MPQRTGLSDLHYRESHQLLLSNLNSLTPSVTSKLKQAECSSHSSAVDLFVRYKHFAYSKYIKFYSTSFLCVVIRICGCDEVSIYEHGSSGRECCQGCLILKEH